MSFLTIPDYKNEPVMINVNHISIIRSAETMVDEIMLPVLNITFSNGKYVYTSMPREILVDLIMRKEKQEDKDKEKFIPQRWVG